MGITSISIIMTVMVLNFHYASPINKKELPQWIRNLIHTESILDKHYHHDQIEPHFEQLDDDEILAKESGFVQWNNVNHNSTPTTIPPPVAFQPNNTSPLSSVTTTCSHVNLLTRCNKIQPHNLVNRVQDNKVPNQSQAPSQIDSSHLKVSLLAQLSQSQKTLTIELKRLNECLFCNQFSLRGLS